MTNALVVSAAALGAVTPPNGGRFSSFEIMFPAEHVALDLQFWGPHGCRALDELYISIRQARTGRFRFGPRVPGARPRREGRRARRWCRGDYRVDVVAPYEFEPGGDLIATAHFTVR